MEAPTHKERKRSKRHRRARHKTSRRQAVEAMKEFALYAQEVNRKQKLKYPKNNVQKYF